MASMTPGEDNPLGGPFDDVSPAPAKPPTGGDGFLDELRSSGEEVVSSELAGMQQAMSRVQSFGQAIAETDVEALRTEWAEIEAELKSALQQGLSAVEERSASRQQVHERAELEGLAAEVGRKNELIAQLSDSVKKLNRELDEKERRLRDDARGLRDRLASAEEQLATARSRGTDAEQARSRLARDLETVTAEVEGLRRRADQATEALAAERAQQDERFSGLNQELNEAHLANSRLETDKREADRKMADAERRLQVAERARARAEAERDESAQEASRATKEAKAAQERAAALESELTSTRDRLERDVLRLRRLEGRLRADGQMFRSRLGEVVTALDTAAGLLRSLPADAPPEDEAADPPDAGGTA